MDSTVTQRFFQPLLLLLAQATDKQLASYLQYLKTENRILRNRLPKRITVTPAERTRLLKVGKPLGRAIKDLITIVSPRTFARWVSQEKKNPGKPAPAAGKGGRPRKPDEVRALILKLASEGAGSGASRIHGILTNLGVRISDATVRRILQQNGIDPGPKRADSTWKEFLKRHRDTLWACDFFTKNVVTKGGIVTFYVLFFIHLKSRRVHVAGMTPAPNGDWMAQQARNLSMYFAEQGEAKPTHIIRDRDTKFTEQFCSILESDGIEFKPIPPRSPNLNPFAERWIQSVKRECLDHFIVFGEPYTPLGKYLSGLCLRLLSGGRQPVHLLGGVMDISRFLSTDQVAFLTAFPCRAIEDMGCVGTPLSLDELVPVHPSGLYTISQCFAVASLRELRKAGWSVPCCLAVTRWVAQQDVVQLDERLQSGQRFAVALQAHQDAVAGYPYERVRLLLDEEHLEQVGTEWMVEMEENDLRLDIVDVGTGWGAFLERIKSMTRPPMSPWSMN